MVEKLQGQWRSEIKKYSPLNSYKLKGETGRLGEISEIQADRSGKRKEEGQTRTTVYIQETSR